MRARATLRNRRILRSLPVLILAVLALALPPVGANHGGNHIQPGDRLGGYCTLNFVFDGPGGEVYIGTAAHCIDDIGEVVSTAGFANFGIAVYDDDAVLDFGLIQVKDSFKAHVLAEVIGHPGMPNGSTMSTETQRNDEVLFSGYGIGFDLTARTRQDRSGLLWSDTASTFKLNGPVVNGDSGGPILHAATGKALGIVSEYGIFSLPPTTDSGPTLQGILAKTAADGFPITLRTAS